MARMTVVTAELHGYQFPDEMIARQDAHNRVTAAIRQARRDRAVAWHGSSEITNLRAELKAIECPHWEIVIDLTDPFFPRCLDCDELLEIIPDPSIEGR